MFRSAFNIVFFALFLASCRETFFYNSKEYKIDESGRKFEITDEEAEAIWTNLKRKIDNGENVDSTARILIKLAQARLSAKNPLQPFTLTEERRRALTAKQQTYQRLAKSALNNYGFVDGCDGLLFTSLLAASGYATNLYQAESAGEPGKWHRNAEQDCLQTGESESTISRDMILGLSVGLWQAGDRASVEEILQYSIRNRGFIGEATTPDERISRAYMTPQLSGLLYEIQYRLGGADNEMRGYVPDFTAQQGFEAHLQALRILLRGALYGGLIADDLEVLATQLSRNPSNALFKAVYAAYTDGNMNAAADALLNTKYFPETRLPTSSDRCEPYLWQRDEGTSDWLPCPEKRHTHEGVDFLFATQYILGQYKLNGK